MDTRKPIIARFMCFIVFLFFAILTLPGSVTDGTSSTFHQEQKDHPPIVLDDINSPSSVIIKSSTFLPFVFSFTWGEFGMISPLVIPIESEIEAWVILKCYYFSVHLYFPRTSRITVHCIQKRRWFSRNDLLHCARSNFTFELMWILLFIAEIIPHLIEKAAPKGRRFFILPDYSFIWTSFFF